MAEELIDSSDAGLLSAIAEEVLSDARARAARMGMNGDVSGLVLLQAAAAMAIADMAGPDADGERIYQGIAMHTEQIMNMVPVFHATRRR